MNALKFFCSNPVLKKIISNTFTTSVDHTTTAFGIFFRNPVGLAAGFDKNAKFLNELETLGFGFVEIGTVTPLPQEGNPRPRLFRLPKDKALINRMGFNNDGVEKITQRLKDRREQMQPGGGTSPLIIGGNIGKNKATANDLAWQDYGTCFKSLHPYVDYFVVNVSSPNTPGLRELQEKESLRKILTHLQAENKKFSEQKPLLLKIAPDLTNEQIDDVIDLALEINLDGLVAANTTISRMDLKTSNPRVETISGGLSGAPLQSRSTELISYISRKTNGVLPVIGSGGIFTGADAREKKDAGAILIQVWTGFVYEGPAIVKKILKALSNIKH